MKVRRWLDNGSYWLCPHCPAGCRSYQRVPYLWQSCIEDIAGWTQLSSFVACLEKYVKKPVDRPRTTPKADTWKDPDFEKNYPHLASYLLDTKYEDGSHRLPSTITIFVQEGYLKACLNDRDNNRSAFVTAPDIETLWLLLETGIDEETLDWRVKK